MRILVTGAAGFLGSHLCEKLTSRGDDVLGIDNFVTGSRDNVAHLLDRPNFQLVKHDITRPVAGRYDRIFNLACPASPPHYQRDPIATSRTCFIGTDNLLTLAAKTGARFFQASTSEVYGDPDVHPQREDYRGNVNPAGPRSCYDEGKRIAESLCFDYQRHYGVDIKVVRIFNTYGPRMNAEDGRVVSNFIVQALRNQDLTIYGNGSQTRSFCYVDDLIDGFLKMMDSPPDVKGPINLGNPAEFTIAELADIVIEMTGARSQIAQRKLPVDDPRKRRPDISKARDLLGWEPKVPLRQGLGRTIAYFDKALRERVH